MGTWSKTAKRFGIIALSAATGGSVYWYLRKESHLIHNSWTTGTIVPDNAKWNHNWDHREPKSLVKPILKSDPTPEEENKYNEKLAAKRPSAVRHLILIRHGQYYLDGATDNERVLSDLGKKQALLTGERLKSLKIPWDVLVFSTMKRAQETGHIIAHYLDSVKIEDCNLIEEGAPVAPEPEVGHWRPEPSVGIKIEHTCS
jgi:serine/threonine-protein phosphatase PGAM5